MNQTHDKRRYVSQVEVQNLGPFDVLAVKFDRKVNVLVGDNGVGKTWLMRLIYSLVLGDEDAQTDRDAFLRDTVEDRLRDGFLLDYEVMVRRGCQPIHSSARVYEGRRITNLSHNGAQVITTRMEIDVDRPASAQAAVFIPSGDALAMMKGFERHDDEVALRDCFGRTYADLAVDARPVDTPVANPKLNGVAAALRQELGGVVVKNWFGYHLRADVDGAETPIFAMSEGHRKVALLAMLIARGSVDQGTTLFWDQPDSSIGPRLLTVIARVLRDLAELGVQIIVSTHSPVLLAALAPERVTRLVRADAAQPVVAAPPGAPVALMTATALLAEYWGLEDLYPHPLGVAMARLGYLVGDPGRSPNEDKELRQLAAMLAQHGIHPEWEPVAIDPALQREDA